MANKMSLANKYRPQSFDDVCEQDSIKVVLENQIRNNNLKHAYLFCGGAGTGKAQPLDSLVLTPTGYVKMRDVYVGQEIIDGLGNKTTITDIFPQGIKPIYKVTFSDRTSVLCSNEHLWKVGEYNKHKKCVEWEVKSIEDMLKYGIRKRHSKTSTRLRYRIPTPIINCWEDNNLIIDPYVLGVLIGDGCITTGARFANAEQDIVDKVNCKLNKSGFELHKLNQSDITKCNVYDIVPIDYTYTNQYHKTGFVNLLKKLDVCKKSVDKHIPIEYLYSSEKTRIELLQGLFDTDGYVDNRKSRGVLIYNTSSEQLSNDFAFLVRSLGGTDTVVRKSAGYKKDGMYIKCNDTFKHTIKFSTNILPFSSIKHTRNYIKPQNKAQRKIVNIEYIGEQECQCIKVRSDDHTYITDNLTVTHNTTSARIIAKMMNEGKSKPIELDCASHNGVDDMRLIIDECKTRPIASKYKIFVLDECFVPETEILTDKGYKQFKDLDHTEKIAQYNDDGSIEFVTPIRYIKQHYEGNLECWQPRRGHTIKMTPNHQQPLLYNKSGNIISKSIKDIKFAQSNSLILSGKGKGEKDILTDMDRLAIICQADGCIQYERETYNRWLVSFKKDRKINRFLEIANRCGLDYTEINTNRVGCKRYTFSLPKSITKTLSTHFNLNISYTYAREFIEEIKCWDGYIGNGYIYYSSKEIENTSFVSAVATLGGYCAKQKRCVDKRSEKYSDIYRLWLYDTSIRNCQNLQKYRNVEYYNGDVYCVEVPSHKIIVRADGYTFISGNCHMLTVQAWNSLLKILEEPPEYVIFLFCTTDPQKIIGTIMSRVQRFNFQRISVDGIFNRLKYIVESENKERVMANTQPIIYDDEALRYIARLARGGMRDSITTLEKCLDYNEHLTMDNVLKVTSGGVTEDTLLQLTRHILNGYCKEALLHFNQIYMSGVDVSLFVKLYTEFLENCTKYLITLTPDITILSDETLHWLDEHKNALEPVNSMVDSILEIKTNYSSEDLKIIVESWIVRVCK